MLGFFPSWSDAIASTLMSLLCSPMRTNWPRKTFWNAIGRLGLKPWPSKMEEQVGEWRDYCPSILLETPKSSIDVRRRADVLRKRRSPTNRAQHYFVRKLMKALDMKNVQIAELQQKVRFLEQVIKRLRRPKRAKVEPNPNNKRFVTPATGQGSTGKSARSTAQEE